MKHTIFTGAGVAIVTPMNQDGSVNYDKMGELLDFQLDGGTDAIVVCGTTGESSTLSDQEHIDLIAYTVKRVARRVPVIAGVGSNDTKYAMWLSREAETAGADGLLHVTPYYNKTSQAGLVKHFYAIADSVSLPIVVYNVPSRTGVNIKPETYQELSRHPHIAAAKEANGDIAALAKTRYLCSDDLDIYSGNDDQIVPVLSLGGKGVISVLSNIMPRETHDICQLYFERKTAESAKLQIALMPLINALFMDVNPIPVKEALNMMGWHVGECRLPLAPMADAGIKVLCERLREAKLIP